MKRLRCFVSAFIDAPRILLDALAEADVEMVSLDSISSFAPISETVAAAIQEADAVCAFIPPEVGPWVWYEVGVAKASGKPLVVVVPRSDSNVPAIVQGERILSLQGRDPKSLGRDLSRLLRAVPLKQEQLRPALAKPARPASAKRIARDISAGKPIAEHRLIEAVADLLRAAGASLVETQSLDDHVIDVAAWFDEIERSIGNPLAVEVKRIQNSATLRDAEAQLGHLLAQQRFGAGLVVYYPSLPGLRPEAKKVTPTVVTMSFEQLLELVSHGEFLATFARLRNAKSHKGE